MNRKPEFINRDNLGPCFVYPVLEDRSILVPLQAWRDGVRKFAFVDASGEYTVSGEVEYNMRKIVINCHRYFKSLEEIRDLADKIREYEDMFADMSEDYIMTYCSPLKEEN